MVAVRDLIGSKGVTLRIGVDLPCPSFLFRYGELVLQHRHRAGMTLHYLSVVAPPQRFTQFGLTNDTNEVFRNNESREKSTISVSPISQLTSHHITHFATKVVTMKWTQPLVRKGFL